MRSSTLTAFTALALATGAQAQFGNGTPYFPGQRPDGLALADFNGDGLRDIAVTTDAPDKISIFTNMGGGLFSGPVQVLLGNGTSPQQLVARDFDGDGDMDFAVALKGVNAVQLVMNLGGGVFSPGAMTSVAGDEPRHLAAGDLDGDGDMDVVASNRKSDNVSVLLNGGGSLSLLGTFSAGQEPRKLTLGDFDGDGDQDVAVSSHDDRTVRVLANNGGGALSAMATLLVGAQLRPDGLTSADLNGDGTPDLVAATSGNNGGLNFITVFLNTGSGWSGPFSYDSGGTNPDDVAAADLDGDGDVDVVVSNQDSNTVSALANTGFGAFGAATVFPAGVRPGDVELADLDGNGSPDLVASNRDSNDLRVYLNQNAGGDLGTNYCGPANANSSGQSGVLSAAGSAVAAANDLTLTGSQLATSEFGMLLNSPTQGFVMPPGSQGNLCLGGQIGRHTAQIGMTSAGGTLSIAVDLSALPRPSGAPHTVVSGETWNFQLWFRDGTSSNFTDGISILFQ